MLSDFQIRSMCFTFNSGAVEPVSASMPFLSFCLWHDDDESVTTVPTHIREKRVLVVSEGMHCTCHFNCLVLSSLLKLPPAPKPCHPRAASFWFKQRDNEDIDESQGESETEDSYEETVDVEEEKRQEEEE